MLKGGMLQRQHAHVAELQAIRQEISKAAAVGSAQSTSKKLFLTGLTDFAVWQHHPSRPCPYRPNVYIVQRRTGSNLSEILPGGSCGFNVNSLKRNPDERENMANPFQKHCFT